ncbi:hypothetical protein ACH4XT_36970 [Streptomyces avidinii]|uniref:hypothetical protein n=1 Tax=Streptomyces avidinii TaxID=1895 RepID=UPI003790C727
MTLSSGALGGVYVVFALRIALPVTAAGPAERSAATTWVKPVAADVYDFGPARLPWPRA